MGMGGKFMVQVVQAAAALFSDSKTTTPKITHLQSNQLTLNIRFNYKQFLPH